VFFFFVRKEGDNFFPKRMNAGGRRFSPFCGTLPPLTQKKKKGKIREKKKRFAKKKAAPRYVAFFVAGRLGDLGLVFVLLLSDLVLDMLDLACNPEGRCHGKQAERLGHKW
jgi:hypothetical protein